MKTLFKYQDLWDLVEQGVAEPDEDARLKENKKKDSKALFFILQSLHENIFSQLLQRKHGQFLRKEYQGDAKVITVKLQGLHCEFETLFMKNGESVQDFISEVLAIVNQMRTFGENCSDQTVVVKYREA